MKDTYEIVKLVNIDVKEGPRAQKISTFEMTTPDLKTLKRSIRSNEIGLIRGSLPSPELFFLNKQYESLQTKIDNLTLLYRPQTQRQLELKFDQFVKSDLKSSQAVAKQVYEITIYGDQLLKFLSTPLGAYAYLGYQIASIKDKKESLAQTMLTSVRYFLKHHLSHGTESNLIKFKKEIERE